VLLRAYPDLDVAVEDLIAERDKVVARNTVTGTHQGDYMGPPPTGKSVTYNEIFILRFAGGRITEICGVVDALSQMKQLGLIPGRGFMTTATESLLVAIGMTLRVTRSAGS
jgi:predicted ester cyclase